MATKVRRLVNAAFFCALAVSSTVVGVASSANADIVMITAKPKCDWGDLKDFGHVSISFWNSGGQLITTRGMWPKDGARWPKDGVRTMDDTDRAMALGNGKPCKGVYSRLAYVSPQRSAWLQNNVATAAGTNCQYYMGVGKIGGDSSCSCVNFATRVWRQVTADRERWQFMLQPVNVAAKIYEYNGNRTWGLFDNGKIWN